jgi:hypothetical protein
MTDLTNPIFTDEDKAREHLEALRWPKGPVCPHCGSTDEHVAKVESTGKRTKPVPEGQEAPSCPQRSLRLQRLQRAVHGAGRHRA